MAHMNLVNGLANLFQAPSLGGERGKTGREKMKRQGSGKEIEGPFFARVPISCPESSGFLSTVGRLERLWDNGISLNIFLIF